MSITPKPPAAAPDRAPAATPPAADASENAVRGIALLVTAELLFATMDTLAKLLGQEMPVAMVAWGRYAFQFGFMLMFFPGRRLLPLLRIRRVRLTFFRGVLLLTATMSFFTAIRYIPLADAVAIGFVAPLFVVALSIPMLGETVGPRRWAAVLIGLIGVVVIVRPGFVEVHWAYGLMIFMAFIFAIFVIVTRMLTRTEETNAILFYAALMGTVGTSLLLPFFWQTPTWEQLGWMAAMGAIGGVSQWLMISAYRVATASTLAPFQYVQITFAAFWGYMVFGDIPDIWVILGGTIVIASGLYVIHREATLAKKE